MCNSKNSNQEKLREVISQMTALTNAVDRLRAEVHTMKVKSLSIQKEGVTNESDRRAMIVRNCGNKNCIAFRKLRECHRIRTPAACDCRANVDRDPVEKVYLHSPSPPKSQVPDFNLYSSPETKYSRNSSSSSSSSEESLSSSVLKSESVKKSTSETQRPPEITDPRAASPTIISHSIGNEPNDKEKTGKTSKLDNKYKKRKNEELDVVSEPSISPAAIESKAKQTSKKPKTEKIVNEAIPESIAGISDSKDIEAVQDINKFETAGQKNLNRTTRPKKSNGKLMKVVQRKLKQNEAGVVDNVSEDRRDKSDELSDNSLESNRTKETPTCMSSFKENFGSLCSPLCRPRKKTTNSKLDTKSYNRVKTQTSSTTSVCTESESLVQNPTKAANKKQNKNEKIPKHQQKVLAQSFSTLDKQSDSWVGKSKSTGRANKKGSRNQRNTKKQKTIETHPSSTVDTETDCLVVKPIGNVNERVRSKSKKPKNRKTVKPSSSTTTLDTQSNSSVENWVTTDEYKKKRRRTRDRKRAGKPRPVETQSSDATSVDTESDSNSVGNSGQIFNENKTSEEKTTTITLNTPNEQVGVSHKVPHTITNESTQTCEEPTNTTKWTETMSSESPKGEISTTVRITDAAVGTTEQNTKSTTCAEDISSLSSLSSGNSTTLGSNLEEDFKVSDTELNRELLCNSKLKKLTHPVSQCRRKMKGRYKIWLLIPFKNKSRSKRCGPSTPCGRSSLRRISQEVEPSPWRSCDLQDHAGPATQEFTPSELCPLLHQNTFQNYRVSSSIPKTGMERPYPFANPTSPSSHFSNMQAAKTKGESHPYHQQLVLNHLRNFDSCNTNKVTSQYNPIVGMTTGVSLTPGDARIRKLESRTSSLRPEKYRYSGCNDPNIPVSSYSSNYSLQNSEIRGFHRLEATEPQTESRKPALFQRVANFFFSRKLSEYVYDPSPQLAGHQTSGELPRQYIYRSSGPSSQTPPYAPNVADPLSRFERLTETRRISHHFDQTRNMYSAHDHVSSNALTSHTLEKISNGGSGRQNVYYMLE